MFVKEFLKLTRFEHAIMLAIAVFIGETIVLGHAPDFTLLILLSLLVPVFSEMGSFALNDYLDIETDKINKKKDRPLVSGTISPQFAFNFAWFAIIISIVLSFFINSFAFAIALVFNLLAIAYNYKLKDLPLLGNIYIGLSMAIPFIFGNFVVSDQLNSIAIILALLGFISGLAREIVKSVQDVEGDKKARSSRTLPIIIGEKPATYVAALLYMLFVPLTILPFILGLKQALPSILLVGIGDVMVIYMMVSIVSDQQAKTLKKARNLSLLALFIGLVGYLVAVL
ncbi:MAG: UbiA family prenyltransferase [Candidatus Micrarchaeota archaeon]|nr:UbiA family prenyltransferase [Candidatus Micrarchaeota archaeon]